MSASRFYTQLVGLTLLLIVLLIGLHTLPEVAPYQNLSWICIVFFVTLSIFVYSLGRQTAQSKNKHTFTNVVLAVIIFKMTICIAIIVSYNALAKPSTKYFILPFFLIYFCYTAFETYVMMKLGKPNKTENP